MPVTRFHLIATQGRKALGWSHTTRARAEARQQQIEVRCEDYYAGQEDRLRQSVCDTSATPEDTVPSLTALVMNFPSFRIEECYQGWDCRVCRNALEREGATPPEAPAAEVPAEPNEQVQAPAKRGPRQRKPDLTMTAAEFEQSGLYDYVVRAYWSHEGPEKAIFFHCVSLSALVDDRERLGLTREQAAIVKTGDCSYYLVAREAVEQREEIRAESREELRLPAICLPTVPEPPGKLASAQLGLEL